MIPVGSAGLAQAMAEVWSAAVPSIGRTRRGVTGNVPNPRVLILVTSLNPVSRAQADRLTQAFPDVVVLFAPAERVGNQSVAEISPQSLQRASSEKRGTSRADWWRRRTGGASMPRRFRS